jgi:hypothetical protein
VPPPPHTHPLPSRPPRARTRFPHPPTQAHVPVLTHHVHVPALSPSLFISISIYLSLGHPQARTRSSDLYWDTQHTGTGIVWTHYPVGSPPNHLPAPPPPAPAPSFLLLPLHFFSPQRLRTSCCTIPLAHRQQQPPPQVDVCLGPRPRAHPRSWFPPCPPSTTSPLTSPSTSRPPSACPPSPPATPRGPSLPAWAAAATGPQASPPPSAASAWTAGAHP